MYNIHQSSSRDSFRYPLLFEIFSMNPTEIKNLGTMSPDDKVRLATEILNRQTSFASNIPEPDFGDPVVPNQTQTPDLPNGFVELGDEKNLKIEEHASWTAVVVNICIYFLTIRFVIKLVNSIGERFEVLNENYVFFPVIFCAALILITYTWKYIHVVGQPQKLLLYKDNFLGGLYSFKPGLSIKYPWLTVYSDRKDIELKVESVNIPPFKVVDKYGIELEVTVSYSLLPVSKSIMQYLMFEDQKATKEIVEREIKSRVTEMFGRNGWDTISRYQHLFVEKISQIFGTEKTLSPLEQELGVNVTGVKCTLIKPSDAGRENADAIVRTRLFVMSLDALRNATQNSPEPFDIRTLIATATQIAELKGVVFQNLAIRAPSTLRTVMAPDADIRPQS